MIFIATKEIAALQVTLALNANNFTKQLSAITRETNKMEKDFLLAQKSLETTENKFKTLESTIKKCENVIEAYGIKLNTLNEKLKTQQDVIDKAKEKHEKLGDTLEKEKTKLNNIGETLGKNSAEYKKQEEVVEKAQKAYDRQSVAVKKAEDTLNRYKLEVEKAEDKQKTLQKSLQSLQQEFDSFKVEKAASQINKFFDNLNSSNNVFLEVGENLKSLGANLTTKITLPLTALGAMSIKTGADFTTSISKCKSISESFADNIGAIEEKAREMGKTTSFTATDAADAMGYMALAGWDAQKSMASIEPVLRLAEAGAMDLALTSDLVTDSMGGLRLEAEDLSSYLDKVAKTSTISNTSIQQLMEAILNCGAQAKSLNIPIEEMNAHLGVLADNGTKGFEAGTKLNSILTRMTAQSGPAAAAWKQLGVEVFDSEGNFRGLTVILEEVNEKLKTMSDEEQQLALKAMVGTDNINDFKNMLVGTEGTVQSYTKSIKESSGSLSEMAKIMKDNLGGDLEKLSSSFSENLLKIFDALEPVIRDIIQGLTKFLDWFGELDPTIVKILTVIGALAAAIGPFIFIIGSLAIAFGTLQIAALVFGTTVGGLVAIVAGVVAAIVALVTAGDWLCKNWDTIKAKCAEVWEAIKEGIKNAVENSVNWIQEKWQSAKDWLSNLWESIKSSAIESWENIKNKITEVCENIKQFLSDAWQTIKDTVVNVWTSIGDFFTETIPMWISNIIQWFNELPYNIGFIIGTVAGHIYLWGQQVWEFFTTNIPMWIESISTWFSELPGKIWTWLTNAFEKINQWGTDVYTNVSNKISETINAVVTYFSELPGKIWTWLTNAYQNIKKWCEDTYNSMSNKARETINAVANWFSTMPGKIWSYLTDCISKMTQWGSQMVSKGKTAAKETLNAVVEGIKSLPSKIFNIGKNTVESLWNGINSMGTWIKNKVSSFVSGIVDGFKGVVSKAKDAATRTANININTTPIENASAKMSSMQTFSDTLSTDSLNTNGDIYQPKVLTRNGGIVGAIEDGINRSFSNNKTYSNYNDGYSNSNRNNFSSNSNLEKLMTQLIQLMMSNDNTITIENVINLDGRQVARSTAKYMETELNSLNKKKLRLAGI